LTRFFDIKNFVGHLKPVNQIQIRVIDVKEEDISFRIDEGNQKGAVAFNTQIKTLAWSEAWIEISFSSTEKLILAEVSKSVWPETSLIISPFELYFTR